MVSINRNTTRYRWRKKPRLFEAAGLTAVVVRLCVTISALMVVTAGVAADEPGEPRESGSSSVEPARKPLFGLGRIFRREPVVAERPEPAAENRFLARVRQLLEEARKHEETGQPEAALESALRADSVLRAAQQTAGVRWPNREENPREYITALKRRTGVTEKQRADQAASFGASEFGAGFLTENPKPAGVQAGRQQPVAVPAPGDRLTPDSALPVESALTNGPGLMLDWGPRGASARIELTAGSRPESLPEAASESELDGDSDDDQDESRLLFQQLGEFESPEPKDASPPLVIPGLIDRPDEIDDTNVGPIPTRPTDSVIGTSEDPVTRTIPVTPDPVDHLPRMTDRPAAESETVAGAPPRTSNETVYDLSPRLLSKNDTLNSSAADSADHPATVWQLATAQLMSTFLGVLLAVGLFLLVRAAATKLFGTRLGVTFHFGMAKKSSQPADKESDRADVVPFGSSESAPFGATDSTGDSQPKRAGGVARPEDFPFRVVGASANPDEVTCQESGTDPADGAILKSVFESNLDLIGSLDKKRDSAA